MIKFTNRERVSELERIQIFYRILSRILLVFVSAFALWLQLEFGILEVLWNKIF